MEYEEICESFKKSGYKISIPLMIPMDLNYVDYKSARHIIINDIQLENFEDIILDKSSQRLRMATRDNRFEQPFIIDIGIPFENIHSICVQAKY